MQVICSWCGKNLGTKKPKHDKRITHGICKKCAAAELASLQRERSGESRLVVSEANLLFPDAGKELKKLTKTHSPISSIITIREEV